MHRRARLLGLIRAAMLFLVMRGCSIETMAERLEKPLPKPRRDPVGYAAARVLEALLESLLALRFLEEGYTRNAAGKAFQAWRALTGALLVICQGKIKEKLGGKD